MLCHEIDKIIYWCTNLEEKAAEWRQLVLEDPSFDLFLIQVEFFKKTKVDMCDGNLFESWFRTAKLNNGNLIQGVRKWRLHRIWLKLDWFFSWDSSNAFHVIITSIRFDPYPFLKIIFILDTKSKNFFD